MKSKQKILVIHGFNSSPKSLKAELTKAYIADNFVDIEVICPQLASTPSAAIIQLCQIIDAEPEVDWYLTGSSLGGYFATYLVDKYQIPAVLINPAVKPFELLVDYIGEQTNLHTGETYQVVITNSHFSNNMVTDFNGGVGIGHGDADSSFINVIIDKIYYLIFRNMIMFWIHH